MAKLAVNKKDDWLTIIPESKIDYFNLGCIHATVASMAETRSDSDNPEPELESVKISVNNLIRVLLLLKRGK